MDVNVDIIDEVVTSEGGLVRETIMEDPVLLSDSTYCRLCAEDNENGIQLFNNDENEQDLCTTINKYLPIKIQDDGKYPRTICPGCNIQLDAMVQFMELIISGQDKIRNFWRCQQELIRRKDKTEQILGQNLFEGDANLGPFTIQAFEENGKEILIQIMPDGSLYAPDHEMSLKIEGLERPRRKRGRPPKPPPPEATTTTNPEETAKKEEELENDEYDDNLDDKKRRRRKVPSRFRETVQGKELERIFREEGVIDEEEDSEDEEAAAAEEKVPPLLQEIGDEVIGHLENKDGQDLGELVIINKGKTRLKSKGRRRKKFNCEICGRGFMHYGRYLVHKTYHKGVKFECKACNEMFTTKEELGEHQTLNNHIGEGIVESLDNEVPEDQTPSAPEPISPEHKYACNQCEKSFMSKQSYEVHVKAIHEGQKPFQCDKCDKTFAYQASLKGHMTSHEQKIDKGYPCDLCDKVFNHPSSVVYHKEAEHNNGRRFVCNKCGKSFKHKQLLQRHQLVHTDDRPFVCKSCGATFKTRANLLNHQPTHTGVKKYFCQQCGQLFAHKTSLTLHYRWHSGQKPYECNVCKKSFSQKGNLREHKRIHTGEKPYSCDYCGRKFTTSSQFKLHVKRHTGERPWSCEYCSKTFLHKDTWKCHMRRHKNERPYQCTSCLRDFTEQWALKKHMRLHTGEKPYVCEICNKAFADCSNLTKHKRVHRNVKTDIDIHDLPLNMINQPGTTQADGNIIYMAYQDPSDSSEIPALVHILDNSANTRINNTLTQNDENIEQTLISNEQSSDNIPLSDFENNTLRLDESPITQVTDEDGNPIYITAQDGQRIRVTSFDGQNLQVCMDDGSIIPIQLGNTNDKTFSVEMNEETEQTLQNKKDIIDSEQQIYVTQLQEKEPIENDVRNLMDQSVQFMTEDGQNVCLVTTVNLDTDIGASYLGMT